MSEAHAQLHTMMKTYVVFEKDRHITVEGFAHIMYPLFTYFDGIFARKITKFKMPKK